MPDLPTERLVSSHPSMCPCCSGAARFLADDTRNNSGSKRDATELNESSSAEKARSLAETAKEHFLQEWLRPGDKKQGASTRESIEAQYDVKIEEHGQKYKYSYKADGKDYTVLESEPSERGLAKAKEELDRLAKEKAQSIEEKYKVTFATSGEPIMNQQLLNDDCTPRKGEMIYAKTPSLRQLQATELALEKSQPSQLIGDGKEGIKIYFADGRPFAQVYGGRWPLGVQMRGDEEKKSHIIVTIDGAKLPATDKDAEPNGRNLKWVIGHELTHNSQGNMWGKNYVVPQKIMDQLGWTSDNIEKDGKIVLRYIFALQGKNGEYYRHQRDDCKSPSVWFRAKEDFTPLNAAGQEVKTLKEAQTFSNEEIMDRAKVRPNTYYFMNTQEMHSEGLTGFRYSRQTREKLLNESPQLYESAKEYDREELGRFYGLDSSGNPKVVRLPDGNIVPRSDAAERAISAFEKR